MKKFLVVTYRFGTRRKSEVEVVNGNNVREALDQIFTFDYELKHHHPPPTRVVAVEITEEIKKELRKAFKKKFTERI